MGFKAQARRIMWWWFPPPSEGDFSAKVMQSQQQQLSLPKVKIHEKRSEVRKKRSPSKSEGFEK